MLNLILQIRWIRILTYDIFTMYCRKKMKQENLILKTDLKSR